MAGLLPMTDIRALAYDVCRNKGDDPSSFCVAASPVWEPSLPQLCGVGLAREHACDLLQSRERRRTTVS